MTSTQQRRGLFRLAFAAVAFALLLVVAQPQGTGSHRASAGITLTSASFSPSLAVRWTQWEWPAATHAASTNHALWAAILPVLFVGLLAPLQLLMVSANRAGRPSAAPSLPCLFQRPPPAQTL